MPGPFRIYRTPPPPPAGPVVAAAQQESTLQQYMDRLVKLVPAEVVALYAGGTAVIGEGSDVKWWLVGWFLICLVVLVFWRSWATRGDSPAEPPQPTAVALAAGAFVVWVYYQGGPFTYLGWRDVRAAGLLVLLYTFLVPRLYKGADR